MCIFIVYVYVHSKQNTPKTLIKQPDWKKTTHNCRGMGSVWVFFSHSYRTHISYTFYRQPIYSPYHGHNYSYLMLTNFKGIVVI